MRTFRITFYPGKSEQDGGVCRIEVLIRADTIDEAKVRAFEKVMTFFEEWKSHNVYMPFSFTEVGLTG